MRGEVAVNSVSELDDEGEQQVQCLQLPDDLFPARTRPSPHPAYSLLPHSSLSLVTLSVAAL